MDRSQFVSTAISKTPQSLRQHLRVLKSFCSTKKSFCSLLFPVERPHCEETFPLATRCTASRLNRPPTEPLRCGARASLSLTDLFVSGTSPGTFRNDLPIAPEPSGTSPCDLHRNTPKLGLTPVAHTDPILIHAALLRRKFFRFAKSCVAK